MDELQKAFVDMQKVKNKETKRKDIIIIVLIIALFLEPIILGAGFLWYESQYTYEETMEEEKTVDVETEGDNANAEYNEVMGNQYNDNAIHNESGADS